MKHTKLVALLLLAAAALSVIGTASAYMVKSTQQVTNLFELANVDCEVVETFADNKKSDVTIKNTSDIPAFIRVRVVSYWEDSKGNPALTPAGKSDDVTFTPATGWVEIPSPSDSSSCRTFYYATKTDGNYYGTEVAVGGSTTELFAGEITLDSKSIDDDGVTYTYHQVVDILAEAVQAMPYDEVAGQDIALPAHEAWGVKFAKPAP